MNSFDMSKISHSERNTAAVYIKDLCKSYSTGSIGKEKVLNNFCMLVKKGTIYGFLGASGCGKTTVLSCVVGLKKWDSGQVLVFGKKPGLKKSSNLGETLGYMPQDLALYNQLSIMETLKFYGNLYNLPNSVMMKQWTVLSQLLNLSNDGTKLIGQLSGGQKRRASLAMSMIHSPQLLVLDEPTVGLDPVLRENIWNYLYQIADGLGTTIIVTTHYIEEARYSDKIGLMRRGRMLVEQSPNELMRQYDCNLLEQVVLKICRIDQDETGFIQKLSDKRQVELEHSAKIKFKSSWDINTEQNVYNDVLEGDFRVLPSGGIETSDDEYKNLKKRQHPICLNFLKFLRKTFGFAYVMFLIFFSYPAFLVMIILLPTIQGTITLWAVGSKPLGLPLGIINNEVGNWKTICESIQNGSFIESGQISGCQLTSGLDLNTLSCQYLNQLKKDKLVKLIDFSTEEQAREQVELGNSWGYMVIPDNFSQSFRDLLMARQYAMNESIEGSRIPVYLDYSQSISSFFITRLIFTSYSNYLTDLAKSCSIDEKMVEVPLKFREPAYGDDEDNYTTFVMPGLLLFTLFGIACCLSGLLLIEDRKQGTLSRATVAGLSCSNVLLSHLIVQGVLTMAQLAIWNLALHFIFSIPFAGQVWLYILICLLCGLSGSAWGMFVGLIVGNIVEALHIGTVFCFILIFRCGLFWPKEAMTKFWQAVGNILPLYLPTQSLRSVAVRGVGIEHQFVWPGILVSLFWTVGFVIINAALYRKRT